MTAALLAALLLPAAARASGPPKEIVEPNGCPDQCCSYGSWRASSAVKLLEAPAGRKTVALVKEGDAVEAFASALYVRPRKVKVVQSDLYDDSTMPKGTVLYIIRPIGDGTWKVWYKDSVISGVREIWDPEESTKVKSTWWVQVRTADGVEGWTDQGRTFDGSRQGNCAP